MPLLKEHVGRVGRVGQVGPRPTTYSTDQTY